MKFLRRDSSQLLSSGMEFFILVIGITLLAIVDPVQSCHRKVEYHTYYKKQPTKGHGQGWGWGWKAGNGGYGQGHHSGHGHGHKGYTKGWYGGSHDDKYGHGKGHGHMQQKGHQGHGYMQPKGYGGHEGQGHEHKGYGHEQKGHGGHEGYGHGHDHGKGHGGGGYHMHGKGHGHGEHKGYGGHQEHGHGNKGGHQEQGHGHKGGHQGYGQNEGHGKGHQDGHGYGDDGYESGYQMNTPHHKGIKYKHSSYEMSTYGDKGGHSYGGQQNNKGGYNNAQHSPKGYGFSGPYPNTEYSSKVVTSVNPPTAGGETDVFSSFTDDGDETDFVSGVKNPDNNNPPPYFSAPILADTLPLSSSITQPTSNRERDLGSGNFDLNLEFNSDLPGPFRRTGSSESHGDRTGIIRKRRKKISSTYQATGDPRNRAGSSQNSENDDLELEP